MADQTIAGEIRASLAREQRSQRWLSDQTGISPTPLGRKLRGEVSFTVEEFLACAVALQISAASIIAAADAQQPAA